MNAYLRMWKAQSAAELLRTMRNRRFFLLGIVMPVMLYFVFVASVGDNVQVGGIDWKAYYLISMTAFGIIGSSLNSLGPRLAEERSRGWAKWLRTTPLPNSAYLFSKILSQAAIHLGIILLMFAVGILVKHIDMPFHFWLESGLWMLYGMIPFLALGTLLGTFDAPEVVTVLSTVLQMVLALLGGLWTPSEQMPEWMARISHALPSYRFAEGAWDIMAGRAIPWETPVILLGYAAVFILLAVWRLNRKGARA